MPGEWSCTQHRDILTDRDLDAVTGGLRFAASFLRELEGHVESKWTPRSFAVQGDLSGGITGAQAGLFEWRRPMNASTASNVEVEVLELSEAELDNVSGGYIGETEKNLSRGTRTDTTSAAASTCAR